MTGLQQEQLRTALGGFLDPLFAYVRGRSPDRETALDLVQEALTAALNAHRGGRQWEDESALWAWLIGVLRNKLADEYHRRRRQLPTLEALDIPADTVAAQLTEPPEEEAGRDEARRLCRLAMGELPPRHRDVLTRFYRDGQSHKDLAAGLGISAKAVESLLARARKELAGVLRRSLSHPETLV
ncbi:MAG: RNA polymerase sigma factor [Planctomycetota bacterium]